MIASQVLTHRSGILGVNVLTNQSPALAEMRDRSGKLEIVNVDNKKQT
jgi:hypothetical protein